MRAGAVQFFIYMMVKTVGVNRVKTNTQALDKKKNFKTGTLTK